LPIGNKFIADHSPNVKSHFKSSAQKDFDQKPIKICSSKINRIKN